MQPQSSEFSISTLKNSNLLKYKESDKNKAIGLKEMQHILTHSAQSYVINL